LMCILTPMSFVRRKAILCIRLLPKINHCRHSRGWPHAQRLRFGSHMTLLESQVSNLPSECLRNTLTHPGERIPSLRDILYADRISLFIETIFLRLPHAGITRQEIKETMHRSNEREGTQREIPKEMPDRFLCDMSSLANCDLILFSSKSRKS
jgi:hypothetical protein